MDIKLYTVIGCRNCFLVKMYLQKHGVKFTEVDGDTDTEAAITAMKKAGVEFLPVLQYDGDNFITGYSEDNLEKLVRLYKS